ncbi:MAG: SpoIIE family protein phosphatase, partial [Planctomycetia bacterium]|nr:SpoIIE family protein phosphatase [Planctomycetia bacterium]
AIFVLSGFLLIYRRILMPIESLAATMRKYALSGYENGASDYMATIWRNNEIGQLANNYNHMVLQIDEYVTKLRQSIVDRIRSEGDLNAARAIQQGILPKVLPPDERMPNVYAAGEVLPARGVGGDLYDTFALDAHHLGIIIGDVSGKGIPAALFMAITQTLQRSLARRGMDPGSMASKLN